MKFTKIVIRLEGAIFLIILFSSFVFGQEMNIMKEELVLEYGQFKVVELAIVEFEKTGFDSMNYKLSVYSDGNIYVAIFEDAKVNSSQRGASPNKPSFEVEIDKNYNVIRSNFVR